MSYPTPAIKPEEAISIPETVYGVTLQAQQKQALAKGESVFLENLQLPNGRISDGKISFLKVAGEWKLKFLEKKEILEIPDRVLNYKLSNKEKEDLLAEKIVPIKVESNTLYLQIDKELNRIVVKTAKELAIPKSIGGYTLSEQDKALFANHQTLPPKVLYNEKNNSYFVASIRFTEDKRGIEYTNYKTVTPEQAKELIEKLNAPRTGIENVTSVSEKLVAEQSTSISEKLITEHSTETSLSKNEESKNSGTLLEHGHAPFENNPENTDSYFVKLSTEAGEKTIWGIDLKRALEVQHVKAGDKVSLEYLGSQPVTVTKPIKDASGKVVGQEPIHTHRNTWKAEKITSQRIEQKRSSVENVVEVSTNLFTGEKTSSVTIQQDIKPLVPGEPVVYEINKKTHNLLIIDREKSQALIQEGTTGKKMIVSTDDVRSLTPKELKHHKAIEKNKNKTLAPASNEQAMNI